MTSGGIGVVGRWSSGSPPSSQTPSFPSESSFITLTWEAQRDFFHPRALMLSLPGTSRGCGCPFFFSSLFRRHSTNPFSARRLAFSFPKATLSRPLRPSGSLDCSSLRLLSALLTPFCLDGRRVSDPVTGATRVRHKSDSAPPSRVRNQRWNFSRGIRVSLSVFVALFTSPVVPRCPRRVDVLPPRLSRQP